MFDHWCWQELKAYDQRFNTSQNRSSFDYPQSWLFIALHLGFFFIHCYEKKNIKLFFNNSNVFRLYKTDLALSGIV